MFPPNLQRFLAWIITGTGEKIIIEYKTHSFYNVRLFFSLKLALMHPYSSFLTSVPCVFRDTYHF